MRIKPSKDHPWKKEGKLKPSNKDLGLDGYYDHLSSHINHRKKIKPNLRKRLP